MDPKAMNTETLLDQAIAAVRDEAPEPLAAQQAADRVRALLAEGHDPDQARFGSHEDYLAALPAYLAGTLPASQALLLEDYSRENLPFRRALQEARSGKAAAPAPHRTTRPNAVPTASPRAPWKRWLPLAATLLVAVGGATLALWNGQVQADLVEVASVEGQLFTFDGERPVPLAAGVRLDENQRVRSGKGSTAVLRLQDGSEVEVAERSEVAVAERRGETTVRVHRGSIIVEAAQQHGHLYVATNDVRVAVTGTIFAVSQATKGSRVAVVEGEVQVSAGKARHVLHSGDQVATLEAGQASSVEHEIAWSRNREEYVSLMRELATLGKELDQQVAAKGERTSSPLLALAPAATAAYVAVPNVAAEIAQFERRVSERLAENPAIADWWQRNQGTGEAGRELTSLLERLSRLSAHVGPEVVFTLAGSAGAHPGDFLLLAGLADADAFSTALAVEIAELNQQNDGAHFEILSSPANATQADNRLYLWVSGSTFAASPKLAQLSELAARLAGGTENPFPATPLGQRLSAAYEQGVQWLAGIDLDRLIHASTTGPDHDQRALTFAGLDNVGQLVIEREADATAAHTSAELSFTGSRQGVASWLAAPAAMGTLDYVSADANLAAAFVVESPSVIVGQIFQFVEGFASDFRSHLAEVEQQLGVSVSDDLAASLGGEMAVALDGPALPTPAWKVIAEVYDSTRLETALEQVVAHAAERARAEGKPEPSITASTSGGRTYYALRFGTQSVATYTYDQGYLVVAPTRALLDQALAVKASGYGLVDAPAFLSRLPQDGFDNFSAVLWTSLGSLGQALGQTAGQQLPAEQREAIAGLGLDAPTLTCAYAEPTRIRFVSTGDGGLFGSRLGSWLGLGALAGAAADHAAGQAADEAPVSAEAEV
jgi:ferric-dicitrate binding protein FerR (iron transport regulator)